MHCNSSVVWGILTTVGAFLFHLSLGYTYTTGNMNSYLLHFMGITSGQTVWFHAVVISAQSIAMPLGGFLEKKIGFRPVVGASALLTSGGIALSNITVSAGLGPFIATYAIMFGLGMGLPYSVLFTLAADWFPKHRSAVTGIILGGFGMGALVFTPIQTALINPDNKLSNDTSVQNNIPRSFLILAGIMFALQIIGFCLLRKNHGPDNTVLFSEDETTEKSKTASFTADSSIFVLDENRSELDSSDFEPDLIVLHNHPDVQTGVDYTVKEALKSIDFYLAAMIIFIDAAVVTLQVSAYKIFGHEHGLDDRYLSSIATCTSIFNCVGRVFWGFVCDHLSFKIPLVWFLLQWAVFFGTLPAIVTLPPLRPLFAIWIFVLYFSMAANFVLIAGASFRIFGPKNMATIYGLIHCTTCPSALILASIVSVHDIKEDFDLVFYVCCALCILSFILSTFMKDIASRLKKVTYPCTRLSDFCRYVPPSVAVNDFGTANLAEKEDESGF